MTSYEPIVPAIPTSLKHRNRKIVLDCFRDYQEHTVADIVTRTGISKLTVMRAIQFFCAKNIIVSSGKGSSTEQGGKKPEFFRFGYKKNLLTIMMWPEMLELRLFDMQMQELRRCSFDWIIPSTPERAFSFVLTVSKFKTRVPMALLAPLKASTKSPFATHKSFS